MALDPLEKERLRRRMAERMRVLSASAPSVVCASGHYVEEPAYCELCQTPHAQELLVIRNRAGKTFHVASSCLKEMVRFRVVDVEDLAKWVEKLKDLKVDHEKRKAQEHAQREEERRRLEKKFIVRKREPTGS